MFAYRIFSHLSSEDIDDLEDQVEGFHTFAEAKVAAIRAIAELEGDDPNGYLSEDVYVLRDGVYVYYAATSDEWAEVRALLQQKG